MSFDEDLRKEIRTIFRSAWEVTDGRVIPSPEDVGLGNKAKKVDISILYADMAGSTDMVKGYKREYCAEIYKTFLLGCCRVIRRNGGELISFDGDRIMGAFIGDAKNSTAAKAALNIKWVMDNIVQKEHDEYYVNIKRTIEYTVAVDVAEHHAVRTGIRGSNDLVWVGNAANLAAKLTNHNWSPYRSIITYRVYNSLNNASKFDGNGRNMWISAYSDEINETVYKSSYHWEPT